MKNIPRRFTDVMLETGAASYFIPFMPELAKKLNSIDAAILLAHLWYVSDRIGRQEDDGFSASWDELGLIIPGAGRKRLTTAIDVLEIKGLISVEHRKGKSSLFVVDREAVEALGDPVRYAHGTSSDHVRDEGGTLCATDRDPVRHGQGQGVDTSITKEEELSKKGAPLFEMFSFEDVVDGKADASPSDGVAQIIHDRWSLLWEKPTREIGVTRLKVWRLFIKAGGTPSDFAKAVVGMTRDPWTGRRDYCEWRYIVRDVDKWIDLFNEDGSAVRRTKASANTKRMHGHTMPSDHVWSEVDNYYSARGYSFDCERKEWIQ